MTTADEKFAAELLAMIYPLRAFARRLCRSPADADDLVQETMLKAWAARERYEPESNMKAWTFAILRNSFLSIMRHRKYELAPGNTDEDHQTVPAPQPAHTELLQVRKALLHISQRRRQALLLVGVAGMSYQEAAKICGCALGTIKSRVSRARSDLQEILDEGVAALETQGAEGQSRKRGC